MNYLYSWQIFLEATRNPEDKVDLFRITSLIEEDKPFNAYSVMKGKNEKTCINFHIGQILIRLKTGRIPELPEDYEPGADEIYFYQYVLDWIEKTGSGALSEDVLSKNFFVEKINRKRDTETGEFMSEYSAEKMTRSNANDQKRKELEVDTKAFRAKVPFSGKSGSSMRNPVKSKISEREIWERQKKQKSFKLSGSGTEKLFNLFDKEFINFFKANSSVGDQEDQIVYWSAIYPEFLEIMKSGLWIWEISGHKQIITDKDNTDYKLGLRITPPGAARQLIELEFDKKRIETDKKNGWFEYTPSSYLQDIKVRSEKNVEGRLVQILVDGTVLIPVANSKDDTNTHRLFFTDDTDKLAKIFSIRKTNMRGGYFVSYIGREREVFDSKSIQDILNFVDSDRKQITLPKIGFTIKKESRFPFRTIPSDKVELRDVLIRYYNLWRVKKGLEPFESIASISGKDVETEDSKNITKTNRTSLIGLGRTIYRKQR